MKPPLDYKLLSGVIPKLVISKAWVSEEGTLDAT